MSGVAVVIALLKANASVTAIVTSNKIMAGIVPINTVLPAIEVNEISGMPRNTVAMTETKKFHTDRVQVSVLFKGPQGTPSGTGYPGVMALLKLVLAACPNQAGTVNGVAVSAILPDVEQIGAGDEIADVMTGSRDFIVKWLGP